MSTDLRPVVSTVADAHSTKTEHVAVDSLRVAIKHGRWRAQIEEIRKRYQDTLRKTGSHEKAKLAVSSLKKKLPGILWSGCFTRRDNKSIERHSGLLCIDIDGLNSHKSEVRQKLSTSPYLYLLFDSPTGEGMKGVFSVEPDASKHDASFRAIRQHTRELAGVEPDEAARDLARICFVSWDPFAPFNPKPRQIEPLPDPEKPPRPVNTNVDLSARQREAEDLLGGIDWESETSGFLTCPGKHLHTTGEGERDCKIDLDKVPTVHCFHSHCRGILHGINKELRSRIGKTEFHAKQNAEPTVTSKSSRDDSEWATDLSSTSLDEARFPAPLEDAAYYGLAGKIVQRVLPETEADPAALLFTILAGFGNMIGRTAYMVADGARHYLNLFVVTVGRTSIARKRTAWVRVKPVLELIDEDWVHNNVESGLSSGEGVIHRIRNKIDEEKPIKEKGKYTGRYETVTVDPGIDDKRLFVLETEFCSPLKVMNREGNTLSPVLRAAWDGDDLGTLTKNSRERATEPHFSMLGHITREELRRSLNETEAANGFGNRNLWIAAKRSKSLPKGGEIPPIADFIDPLQDALLFAHTCGELRRDAEAEELWAQVYTALSEGRPGLFGAITARAAPQILRISGLYAVLDCSLLIRVPHLKAALACWRYAENSARWIFETGTGDKIADRILAALFAAGATGLSKTQIVCDVFNRNVTKFTIDEALRLLHHLKLAERRMETTKGRPAEHWFSKSIDEINELNEQRGTV
jgi:VirE-like protein